MILFCYMIYQDLVTKGSSDFLSGSCLRQITILPSFMAIDIVVLDF